MSGRCGIYRGPNGEKLHGDGREVIASPVPDRVIDDLQKLYEQAHTFNMEEISPVDVMWLVETIRRLEAEKQEAHTEGWNACVEAACDKADFGMIAPEDVRALAKPTVAKQGEPS